MNILEQRLETLNELLTTQYHLKHPQEVWDFFLKLLCYWGVCTVSQQRFLNKAKMILLNNRKWT